MVSAPSVYFFGVLVLFRPLERLHYGKKVNGKKFNGKTAKSKKVNGKNPKSKKFNGRKGWREKN